MNKNTKAKAKFKFKGVILGTSSPIVVTPLKRHEKSILLSKKPSKLQKSKVKHKWKPRRISQSINELKALKASQRKANAFGTAMAQSNWGKGIFTGMYSGGATETNRRRH